MANKVGDYRAFINQIRIALGLPETTNKIVMELEAGIPPKFYVRGIVREDAHTELIMAVQDVSVREDLSVLAEPLRPDPPSPKRKCELCGRNLTDSTGCLIFIQNEVLEVCFACRDIKRAEQGEWRPGNNQERGS